MRKHGRSFIVIVTTLAILLLIGCAGTTTSAIAFPDPPQRQTFTFMVLNALDANPTHRLVIDGHGTFDPGNLEDIEGGGVFQQFDVAPEGAPKPLVGLKVGKWRAKKAIAFTSSGAYGAATAGVLDMIVELIPDEGDPVEATLRVVCNVPPGGLFNLASDGSTLPEGIVLTVPEIGAFQPIVSDTPGTPTWGLTLIGPVR